MSTTHAMSVSRDMTTVQYVFAYSTYVQTRFGQNYGWTSGHKHLENPTIILSETGGAFSAVVHPSDGLTPIPLHDIHGEEASEGPFNGR